MATHWNTAWRPVVALLFAALAACGGGGGGGEANGGTTPPPFVAGNSAEQAYFSGSYEFVGANALPLPQGYVSNAADSTGALNRTRYQASGGVYTPSNVIFAFEMGFAGADEVVLDPWLFASQGVVRNGVAGSYILRFPNSDWFDISGIAEVDVTGQAFGAYLPAAILAGHDGTFPAGSKVYVRP